MDGARILVIEDEASVARFLELELTHEGYGVDVAHSGNEGFERFEKERHDLIILDLLLPPGISGLEVLRRIRRISDVPVIIGTAKGDVMDKVVGLDAGADDYVAKPFAIEELLARIRVALKKRREARPSEERHELRCGELRLDVRQRTVKYGGALIDLTKTEYELLAFLMQNKNAVQTRDDIVNNVWGYNFEGQTNIVDVYVRYLRAKIDERFKVKLIKTVRGVGYSAQDPD